MDDDINNYLPSILNPRRIKKYENGDLSLTQNSVVSRYSSISLSLRKKNNGVTKVNGAPIRQEKQGLDLDKENKNVSNISNNTKNNKDLNKVQDNYSFDFSWIEDLNTERNLESTSSHILFPIENNFVTAPNNKSIITLSSDTELVDIDLDNDSDKTICEDNPLISISFGLNNCNNVNVTTKKSTLKRIEFSHKNNNTTQVDCDILESTQLSTDSQDRDMCDSLPNSEKKLPVTVNIEIKKTNRTIDTEESKVLILNTNATEKVSHVIVQPPNYKIVKRKFFDNNKLEGSKRRALGVNNGTNGNLKQKLIDHYVCKSGNVFNLNVTDKRTVKADVNVNIDDASYEAQQEMSKVGVADCKCDRIKSCKGSWKDVSPPRPVRIPSSKKGNESPRRSEIKTSIFEAPRVPTSKTRNDSASSHSPRKNVDSIQFNLSTKSKSTKPSLSPKNIPHHKIVAGTHFAVDAFSYGEIPNVKHYFLTHFHSDHYSGLKKTFNKFLFCSKITADLCTSRLGVNTKYIHIINLDETIRVEGVEVTAVDANHCPGAIMLVFTLPNGKTLLHTGDFRASPLMESYPIFWNKDVHTVYLDTTYCNPRYDFPTQDQSLEMALYILRQKKLNLEKSGKKFSSVLIVCGTYTIGKEKFFLGMARRVGCAVWACPEKDRVLQAVEGKSFSSAQPHACQLHVLPMRDLTVERLRNYMEYLEGAFTEVVAFKPSGWENGKNSAVEKDMVTIHGIPYSEHSSFPEMIRFVKYLKPKQIVPTVDISGGIKSVQKYFPCPLVYKDETQSKLTDFFSIQNRQQVTAVT